MRRCEVWDTDHDVRLASADTEAALLRFVVGYVAIFGHEAIQSWVAVWHDGTASGVIADERGLLSRALIHAEAETP